MKSLSKIFFLSGFFLLLVTQSVTATEYYVSVNTGSDSNDGSISSPWQTTAHAFTFVGPGDVVNLFEGTYPGIPDIPGGSSGDPVTLRGIPGERVRISDQSVNNGIVVTNDYVVIENLQIDNMPSNGVNIQANWVTVRNCIIRHTGVGIKSNISTKNHHILIERCSFWWYNDIIIFPDEVEKFVVRNCLFQEAASVVMDPGGAEDLLIENNYVDQDNRSLGPLKLRWGNVELVDEPNNNGAIVRNNVFLEGSKYGLLLASANGAMVYNNVMMNNLVIGSLERGILYAQLDPSASPGNPLGPNENNVIKNNIFQLNGGDNAQGSLNQVLFEARTDMVDDLPTWTIDNNLYYKSGGTEYIVNGTQTITESNVIGWGSNFDLNSVVGQDPLLPTLDPTESQDEFIAPSNSPAVDAGAPLTVTVGSGTSNVVTVEDSRYFFGGYGMIPGDEIKIGSNTVTVTDRDIDNNTITIDQSISWTAGQEVTFPYTGSAPDIGVYEQGITRETADEAFGAAEFYAFTKGIFRPGNPTDLTLTVLGTTSIQLNWVESISNEDGFVIQRSETGYDGWTDVDDIAANSESYTDNTLNCGTTYYYRVRAYNAAGISFASNIENETTTGCSATPPAAPTNLAGTPVSYDKIDLHWTDNSDNEAGFEIERSPNGSTGWTLIHTNGVNDTTYTDTVNCNTPYYYQVRATNVYGNSSYTSLPGGVTSGACPTIPNPPSNLVATATSGTSIDLTWADNSSDEEYFLIESSPDGSTGWTQIGSNPAGDNTFSHSGLTCETTYYYRVTAGNVAGNSDYSDTESEPTLICPPAAPTNLSATATSETSIDLTWTDSNNESSYEIERSPNGTSGWTLAGTNVANDVTFTDNTGLSCGTDYYYRVKALNAGGPSDFSNTATDKTNSCIVNAWVGGLTHTAEEGSNRLLVFTAHAENSGSTVNISSVTYGGQTMTKVADINKNQNDQSNGIHAYAASFVLNESGISSASNGNFVVTWDATPSNTPAYASTFLTGVDQTNSIGESATSGSSTSSNSTSALTTDNGDVVILAATVNTGGTFTLNNGFTNGIEVDPISADGVGGHKISAGGSETPSFTHSASIVHNALLGFVVNRSGGGGTTQYTLTTDVSPSNSGSVSLDPSGGTYDESTVVTLTATPNSGYVFSSWSGDLSGSTSPAQITMDGNKSVTANFTATGGGGEDVSIVGSWTSGTSHTAESGTDRLLVFTAHAENSGSTVNISSVTYGGQTMTKVADINKNQNDQSNGIHNYAAAFVLNESGISSASGGNFVVTWDATPSATPAYTSVFLTGVDQTSSIGGSATSGSSTSSNSTSALSTNDGDMVILAATVNTGGTFTLDNGFTNAIEVAPQSADGVAGYKSATGANETPSFTHSASIVHNALLGFVVTASSGGGSPPPAPTNLSATATSESSIDLTWDEVSGEDNYQIESSPDGISGWTLVGTNNADDNTFTHSGLDCETPYYYQVRAVNSAGNSSYSNPDNATTSTCPSQGWTQLTYDDFEGGSWGNYTDGNGSSNNYCRLVNNASHAHEGTYSANIERGDPSQSYFVLTNGIDLDTPGYTQLKVEFWYKGVVNNGSPPEALLVEYYDGSSWSVADSFIAGVDFTDDSFKNPTVLIDESNYTFPTDMKIRFRSACTSSNDDFYIDEIKISGYGTLAKIAFTDKTAEVVIPEEYTLANYPNPFNPSTIIQYGLPEAGYVELTVYDITGRKVSEVFKGNKSAGTYSLTWNAKDTYGRSLSSGVYFLTIRVKEYSKTIKMMYLR